MKAIYKRELRSFFSTMTGYVFTAIVVLFVAFNFSSVNLTSGYPYFAAALSGTLLIFILAVPILTMRSFADERRSKTEQLLMSYPVTTTSVVLGKYLAMLTVYAIPLLISCLCPLVISTGFTSSFLIDYSSIFAFMCLGTLFVSVGMYISTLTESVVIAAVGTMAAILLILLWATLVNMIPEKSWLIPVKDFLHLFGTASVLTNFTSMHVFDFKGIILLLAEAAFFVILTVRSVSGRRWR